MNTENQPWASIIIPLHNAQDYVDTLVKDLKRQTCPQFEAILINDGSTDDTQAHLARLVEGDARFRLLYQANAGPGAARNTGLAAARGSYALFIDADDSVKPLLVERVLDTVRGNVIPRRASHVLVSDQPCGPYRPMADATYLPEKQPTLDGTFWVDTDGKPYMVYCGEWLQNWDGTIEKIELKPDLSGSVGQGKVLFRASASPWSHEVEDGKDRPNKVTDGPYLFRTGTGRLGMIWTSWIDDIYTQGVAYSESGTLDGPWVQEPQPITPPNFGHGMLFRTLDGRWLMSVHSHKSVGGRYIRVPHLFEVDLSGDKLVVGRMVEGEWK